MHNFENSEERKFSFSKVVLLRNILEVFSEREAQLFFVLDFGVLLINFISQSKCWSKEDILLLKPWVCTELSTTFHSRHTGRGNINQEQLFFLKCTTWKEEGFSVSESFIISGQLLIDTSWQFISSYQKRFVDFIASNASKVSRAKNHSILGRKQTWHLKSSII